MIGSLFARFALGGILTRVPWQIWAALAVALFLGVTAWQIDARAYKRGFADAEQQWQERVAIELARQDDANRTALRIAQEQIQRLQEAKDVRDGTIRRLIQEANEDPGASSPAVGTDSVRRLNSIID